MSGVICQQHAIVRWRRTVYLQSSPREFWRSGYPAGYPVGWVILAVQEFRIGVSAASGIPPFITLARIIHEGRVNNPGLPDHEPFPHAAGGCLMAAGCHAASAGTGDA